MKASRVARLLCAIGRGTGGALWWWGHQWDDIAAYEKMHREYILHQLHQATFSKGELVLMFTVLAVVALILIEFVSYFLAIPLRRIEGGSSGAGSTINVNVTKDGATSQVVSEAQRESAHDQS